MVPFFLSLVWKLLSLLQKNRRKYQIFRILCWITFNIITFLKEVAEKSSLTWNFRIKNWLEFVCFDSSVGAALKKNSSQQMSQKLCQHENKKLLPLAKEFWVSYNIKNDHNNPNYNPYLHRFFCSKLQSYHSN